MAVTAYVAAVFKTAMHAQTGGVWSAPLDDVFIHFDYARSTARGYPFQWSEGNGYSSGNTSLLYPFVLAIGYRLGWTGLLLMQFAMGVAVVAVFTYLFSLRRVFDAQGRQAKYLLPPVLLSLGALDWSLMSGMENAFHLAMFGLVIAALLAYERRVTTERHPRGWLIATGLAGVLLVYTRPESAVSIVGVAAFVVFLNRSYGVFTACLRGVAVGLPAAIALGVQAGVNRVFTGEWSQAGSIAKLALTHPYMTRAEKIDEWIFHFKYVLTRNLHHHFADVPAYGYIVPAIALVPLFDARVRRYAALLWWMVASYLPVVALNGQVRWQNERYTMPAVAWLFTLAALGLGSLTRAVGETLGGRLFWGARVAVAGIAASVWWHHQLPNVRDQIWFFARASRNIHDQQYQAGLRLREIGGQIPRRVLVGDAGAVSYGADIPALDIIGLGGYHDLPFARATRHGLGAALELIERIPPRDRPNYMAIYPSWWGDLPTLFGTYVDEVPVVGNVICGGPSKVIYRAHWDALDKKGEPRSMGDGETIVSELDVADLVSERAVDYTFPRPAKGWVVYHLLTDPQNPRSDLFDAGRIIADGDSEKARMAMPSNGGYLIVRTANIDPARVDVKLDGRLVGVLDVAASDEWRETWVPLPPGLPPTAEVELTPRKSTWTNYHVWITEKTR